MHTETVQHYQLGMILCTLCVCGHIKQLTSFRARTVIAVTTLVRLKYKVQKLYSYSGQRLLRLKETLL